MHQFLRQLQQSRLYPLITHARQLNASELDAIQQRLASVLIYFPEVTESIKSKFCELSRMNNAISLLYMISLINLHR
jgi:hypothetical protein